MKREYRGQRSTEALAGFVREQLTDPVQMIQQYYELSQKVYSAGRVWSSCPALECVVTYMYKILFIVCYCAYQYSECVCVYVVFIISRNE